MDEMEPLVACETDGQCRKNYHIKWGLSTDHQFGYGIGSVNLHGYRHTFRCCTMCHRPADKTEAARINDVLGLSATDIKLELDDDFLNALDRALE